MPEATSKGQQDKAATEKATAATAARQDKEAADAAAESPSADEAEAKARVEASDAAALSEELDRSQWRYDPYPAYDEKSLDELRSLAADRDVEINRDVEKAELIRLLRAHDRGDAPADTSKRPADIRAEAQEAPNYDVMTLDQLRSLTGDRGLELPQDFERGHLVGELRAADTHTR